MKPGGTAAGPPRTGVAVFIVLVAMSGLGPLSFNIILPSLPRVGRDFGIDYGTAQLTFSLFVVSMAISIVLAGPLTDIFGRRPILFAGLGLYLLATLASALAPNIATLVCARIAQAAGASGGIVISRATIGDLYESDRAASMMGYMTMAYGLAPLLSPLIGGVLDEAYGWRASFAFLFLFAAAILTAAWRVMPETTSGRHAGAEKLSFLGAFSGLVAVRAFWAVALTNAFASAVYFTFLAGASFVSENLFGLSPATYGGYLMLVVLGYICGNWLTGRYATRFGSLRLVTAGSVMLVLVVLVMWAADLTGTLSPATFFAPTLIMGLSHGLITPNCVALSISVRPRLAGTAVGIGSGVQLGCGGLASTVIGWWIAYDASPFPLMAQMAMMAALALVCVLVAARLLRRGHAPAP